MKIEPRYVVDTVRTYIYSYFLRSFPFSEPTHSSIESIPFLVTGFSAFPLARAEKVGVLHHLSHGSPKGQLPKPSVGWCIT